MGIFSKRDILQGEEVTFNYNVDRYGYVPFVDANTEWLVDMTLRSATAVNLIVLVSSAAKHRRILGA